MEVPVAAVLRVVILDSRDEIARPSPHTHKRSRVCSLFSALVVTRRLRLA